MTITEIKQSLQSIDFFEGVPDEQMQWLAENMELKIYKQGDLLFKAGEPATHMYVIHDGLFSIYIDRNGKRQSFAESGTKDITGVLPYSRMKVAAGNGEATRTSTVFALDRNKFHDMICNQYELTEVLVHRMTDRIRNFTTLQQQNEKLASLGKLSAGLAHELNNPASAVVRSSEALKKHLKSTPEKFKLIMDIKVNAKQIDVVNEVLFLRLQATENTQLSLMEKTALEDELTDWMDDKNMEDSMEWAEVFAEFNFCVQDFERVNQEVPDKSLSSVFGWMVGNLVTEKMVSEIADASKRISDLVGSVKNYTHMDRSQDKQPTDLHLGLRSTVTMLGHKFRKNKVQVDEQFGEIPDIQAFPGEVNQVFTNLIDNANKAHIPNHISVQIHQVIHDVYKQGGITGDDHRNIKEQSAALLDILGACERIKKTPIPFSYSIFIKIFILVYSLLLPFALVAEWGIWTVPIIMLVFFAFIGVEMMGSESEDPFGLDCNDLPTGTIAHTIKENVFEILEAKKGDNQQAKLYDKIF